MWEPPFLRFPNRPEEAPSRQDQQRSPHRSLRSPGGLEQAPERGPQKGLETVDTLDSSAPLAHPSTEECFVCYDGLVYIGRLEITQEGEEVEVVAAYPLADTASKRREERDGRGDTRGAHARSLEAHRR